MRRGLLVSGVQRRVSQRVPLPASTVRLYADSGSPGAAVGDQRASWFRYVWVLATQRADASLTGATLPASAVDENPATLASQLLKVRRGGESSTMPYELTSALWDAHDGTARHQHAIKLHTGPPDADPARSLGFTEEDDVRRVRFWLTMAQLGVDLDGAAKACDAFGAKLAACKSLNAAGSETCGDARRRASEQMLKHGADVRLRATPIHERWFVRTLALPNGAKRLIDTRDELLNLSALLARRIKAADDAIRHNTADADAAAKIARWRMANVALATVEASLTAVLREWSSVAWLTLEEAKWDSISAALAERIQQHEAVHTFPSLNHVKHRMQPTRNRRLFCYLHPGVAGEPLVMVQVALTKGIASNVDRILDATPELDFSEQPGAYCEGAATVTESTSAFKPDTAIFYSISSTQDGLRGIDLGNQLIKGAVGDIQHKDPTVQQYSTLSPIPGYGRWLEQHAAAEERALRKRAADGASLTVDGVLRALFGVHSDAAAIAAPLSVQHLYDVLRRHPLHGSGGGHLVAPCDTRSVDAAAALSKQIVAMLKAREVSAPLDGGVGGGSGAHVPWWTVAELTDALRPLMVASGASYLFHQKRRGRAFDPVANFHIKNGATLHRVNWLGNCTPRASAASACMMVNYLYDLPRVDAHAAQYSADGVIATSPSVLWETAR